jgi:hypothetical protein
MRVATSKLKAGTVMISGETIVSLEKSGKSYMARGPRLNVVLEKNGKRRLADWNYYGTVSVRSEKKDES